MRRGLPLSPMLCYSSGMTNIAKGNARVGIQVGGGTTVKGNVTTHPSGVKEHVEHVERSANHPDGPGITRIVHYTR